MYVILLPIILPATPEATLEVTTEVAPEVTPEVTDQVQRLPNAYSGESSPVIRTKVAGNPVFINLGVRPSVAKAMAARLDF